MALNHFSFTFFLDVVGSVVCVTVANQETGWGEGTACAVAEKIMENCMKQNKIITKEVVEKRASVSVCELWTFSFSSTALTKQFKMCHNLWWICNFWFGLNFWYLKGTLQERNIKWGEQERRGRCLQLEGVICENNLELLDQTLTN